MGSWKQDHPKQLRKIARAMTKTTLKRMIKEHESRGWMVASEVKKHGYGFGCLMIFPLKEE